MTTSDSTAELSFVDLLVDGASKLDLVRDNLLDVMIEQDLFLPDACTIRIADVADQPTLSAQGYFTILDSDALAIGASLVVKLGYEEQPATVFDGEITAIEVEVDNDQFPVLVVRGYDRSHRMRRERKTAAHVNTKDSDIATKLARMHGLSASTVDSATLHTHVFQDNQSDWDFLRQRAARIGFDMFVNAKTLYFQPIGNDSTTITATLGDTLHRARVRMSAQNQVSQVAVRGWDPTQKAPIVATQRQGTLRLSIGETRTGADMANSMGTGKYVVAERVVTSEADAQKLAQAMYDAVVGDFLQVDGVCTGDSSLRPGRTIELKGMGRRLSGKYYATAVTHRRRRGEAYVCSFVVNGRRPATLSSNVPLASGALGTQRPAVVTAIVTDNKDPDKLGRVKVKFPWLDGTHTGGTDGVTSGWARLASPMAGSSRGLVWLPEVADEVLVAFEQGDINRPFVIGALWNGQDRPPAPAGNAELVNAQGKVERRLFTSRTGHTLLFDDSETSPSITVTTNSGHSFKLDDTSASPHILLRTKTGHSIKLDDTPASSSISIIDKSANNFVKVDSMTNAVQVKATGSVSLEATGNMSIKAASITIEATGAFTLKSNGTGSVQAAGPLTVRGALVQIN